MHHLISGINSPTHFVSYGLIYLLLTHHTSMIISPRHCHYHHFCHPLPRHSFILISKLFFFSNPIRHRHLAPPRSSDWLHENLDQLTGFIFTFFSFFWVLVFIISPPENDSFRKDLCFTRDVFFFLARSPRCVGRSAWNFARWSVLGTIL